MKASFLFRIASVLLILFAVGHTLGFRRVDPRWGVDSLINQLRSTHFNVQGFSRTYWDFFTGFGLFVTILSLWGYGLVANWRVAKGIIIGDVAHYLGPGDLLRHSDIFELPIFLYCAGHIFWRDCRLPHSRGVACWLDTIVSI